MPPAIPDKIPCESVQQLEQELATLREALSYPETEETWDRIARALTRFGAVVKGGGYKFEKELVHGVKTNVKPIVSAMNSERTRLSAASLDCITIIAPRIGLAFEALASLFVPHILHLATRSNKVYVTRSQATMGLILGYCHIPAIIPHLVVACKESKIVTGRAIALEGVLRCLNKWDWAQREIKAKVSDVEDIIRITGRDKDAGIRQTSRKVFEAYKILFPERVEEFTGPLTPVMRKYLDIKPLQHGQKPTGRSHQQSAAEKPRRPLPRPDFAASTSAVPSDEQRNALGAHVRSASSNAIVGTSSSVISNSQPPDNARSMLPPAIIPNHARTVSRSQARPHTDRQQDETTQHERQRVMSTASTYSIKSAPAESHSNHEHRPPMRLVNSQTQSSRPNLVTTGSSGQARRVPKAAPEPHPANRPDTTAVAHKAPMRPTSNATGPKASKTNKGPSREIPGATHGGPFSAVGIAFPTSEPVERKGAQRVPKPAPTPASAPTTPPKAERPATAMGITSKREVKPSIFRRGVPDAPGAGKKEGEKKQEGFVPRRAGGVTQPTLSQLSKQKASVSVNTATSQASKARAPPIRPAWGASKTAPTRVLPVLKGQLLKGQGRSGIARAQTPELADKPGVGPAMVPLPASPKPASSCNEKTDELPRTDEASQTDEAPLPKEVPRIDEVPQANNAPQADEASQIHEVLQTDQVPLADEVPQADEALQPDEVPSADETPNADEETSNEASEVAVQANEARDEMIDGATTHEDTDDTGDPQQDEVERKSNHHSNTAQESDTAGQADNVDSVVTQTGSAPHTPPFPPTDGESDEDELDDIEFTTRSAYAPGGAPIKTPRKLGVIGANSFPERSPLGEVVLNA